jgi:hypothetical protein
MRTRFTYTGGGDWTTVLPARPWTPADETLGGRRVAGSGVPATYIVRRDALLDLTLRLLEAEWDDLLALVTFGQTGGQITWYPDVDDAPGTSFTVYLEAPAPGMRWAPTRLADYPRALEQALTLRGVASAPWQAYFT